MSEVSVVVYFADDPAFKGKARELENRVQQLVVLTTEQVIYSIDDVAELTTCKLHRELATNVTGTNQ